MTKIRMAHEIYASGGIRIDQPKPPEFQICNRCEMAQGDHRAVSPTPIATEEEFAAWKAYLARWTLDYPVKARFEPAMYPHPDGIGWFIRINFLYPEERDARDPSKIPAPSMGLLSPSRLPDRDTPRWLRANLLYHLNHELDEWLRFDDQVPFDPHHQSVYQCEDCIAKMEASQKKAKEGNNDPG